jgi:hypothetical protein
MVDRSPPLPIPPRVKVERGEGELRLIIGPRRFGLLLALVPNCLLVLIPILLGWRTFVTSSVSSRIGQSILACMLLPVLLIATGWYRLILRELVVLRPETLVLQTDFRLFRTTKVFELKLVRSVGKKEFYLPRTWPMHRIFIDSSQSLEGSIYWGENLSDDEASYVVAVIKQFSDC